MACCSSGREGMSQFNIGWNMDGEDASHTNWMKFGEFWGHFKTWICKFWSNEVGSCESFISSFVELLWLSSSAKTRRTSLVPFNSRLKVLNACCGVDCCNWFRCWGLLWCDNNTHRCRGTKKSCCCCCLFNVMAPYWRVVSQEEQMERVDDDNAGDKKSWQWLITPTPGQRSIIEMLWFEWCECMITLYLIVWSQRKLNKTADTIDILLHCCLCCLCCLFVLFVCVVCLCCLFVLFVCLCCLFVLLVCVVLFVCLCCFLVCLFVLFVFFVKVQEWAKKKKRKKSCRLSKNNYKECQFEFFQEARYRKVNVVLPKFGAKMFGCVLLRLEYEQGAMQPCESCLR